MRTVTLPIIGQVVIGRPKPSPDKTKISHNLGAAFLDLSERGLTSNTTVSNKVLEAYEGWVYANVSVLAEEVSKIEFELYRTSYIKGELQFDPINTHELLDLLDRFNPFTTTSEGIYTTEAHLELAGDAFFLLDNTLRPQNIFLLQPDKVEVVPGSRNNGYFIKAYKYKYQDEKGQTHEKVYNPDLVIQFKNPHPSNPLRGKSVVEAAAKSIDLDVLVEEFLKKYFKNNATPGLVLSSDQRITQEDIKRIEADLRKNYGGTKNAFKSLILSGGLKPTPLQSTLRDMLMLELEDHMRDKIMALFKNTKASLGITEDVNRANAEASILAWKQTVIKPKMKRITDTLNEFLVPRYGNNLILGFKDPVPEDKTSEIEEATKLKTGDIITINEARELLDYEPIAGGDEMGFEREERRMEQEAKNNADKQPKVPKALRNISLRKAMRRQGVYQEADRQKNLYDAARQLARKQLAKAKVTKAEPRKYHSFSNSDATGYWAKQIKLTEMAEQRFKDRLNIFLEELENKAVANLHKHTAKTLKKAFEPFDESAEVRAGIDLFTPLALEIAELSAFEAYVLLDVRSIYSPSKTMRMTVEEAVKLFTESFVNTDREELTAILQDGIDKGNSIPQIETAIREKFGHYRKEQSQTIARTEILRASNAGALDAFEQSGVVEAKQWYTARDGRVDPQCEELDGKIVGLRADFFETKYESGERPPRHPRCRCVLLPVLRQIER